MSAVVLADVPTPKDWAPFIQDIYRHLFGSARTCIDLCAGEGTFISHLSWERLVSVDLLRVPVKREGIIADVLGNHSIFNERFDLAVCFDGIEHQTREDGLFLLARMQAIATRQVVFTPLGPCDDHPDNAGPDKHKSHWSPEDVPVGWRAIIMRGFHRTWNWDAWVFWSGIPPGDEQQALEGLI